MNPKTESPPSPEEMAHTPTKEEPLLSRRSLFTAGLGGAAIASMSRRASAQQGQSGLGGTSQQPTRPFDPIYFLVSRLTFGFTVADYQQAKAMGYENYLEWQLDWKNIDDSALDAQLAQFTTLGLSVPDMLTNYSFESGFSFVPATELRFANIYRRAFTRRQLHEKMVTFWTNHFSVDIADGYVRFYKMTEDLDEIRPRALGKFSELLTANAHSPAMLYYLDNYTNFASGVQENYARELLELHTLGVYGGYTETDVIEVARCLTGWGISAPYLPGSPPPVNPDAGQFEYFPTRHDNGAKTVLGVNIPANGGESDGDNVLKILLGHPSTAQFIATKMCNWFLGYDPPKNVVARVTRTFSQTNGDVKAMIREIFSRETLEEIGQPNEGSVTSAESPKMREFAKFKRPHHYISSVLRALNSTITDAQHIIWRLDVMGHIPFSWPSPDGPPDTLEAWGSALMERWGFASQVTSNTFTGIQTQIQDVFAPIGGVKANKVARQINLLLTGGHMHPDDEKAIDDFLKSQPAQTDKEIMEAVGLGLSSPSFQWY